MSVRRVTTVLTVVTIAALTLFVGVTLAHGGTLANAQAERITVPTWLYLITGGGVIGASFILASFVTDRALIQSLNSPQVTIRPPGAVARWMGGFVGMAGLLTVFIVGFLGPRQAVANAAILLIWVGWWAGYAMTVYLGGNSWPVINPLRTLTRPLGDGEFERSLPRSGWFRLAGLLALVWIEVVSPLAGNPRFLALTMSLYVGGTLAGAYLVGADTWFTSVDPVSEVFRQYGKVAPVQCRPEGLSVALPGATLNSSPARDRAEVGFILAMVWGTTYDGLVQTPLWADAAVLLVETGVPSELLYPAVLLVGYAVFAVAFWLACRSVRRVAPTYLATVTIARQFAPSLLAIAAGYHLAHFFGFFLQLSPALFAALASPFRPAAPAPLALPGWTAILAVVFVLLGHLLAIWVAHGVAYEQFPGRLQAIRSQMPITLVMVGYTMLSLWIVTRPFSEPPYL